jgi:ferredoxin
MVSKRIVLHFPHRLVNQPIVCKLVKDYDLEFNILKASIKPNMAPTEEGLLVLELSGENHNYEQGIRYLQETGVKLQPLSQDVVRNDRKCSHCGVCVTICPSGSFVVDPVTREVRFHDENCVACEFCVKACPRRAMEVQF